MCAAGAQAFVRARVCIYACMRVRAFSNSTSALPRAPPPHQGTPYAALGGAVELGAMAELRLDAFTLGNHDFDAGVGALLGLDELILSLIAKDVSDFSKL